MTQETPPVQVAHREYHADKTYATLKIGAGWNPGIGDEVIWSWKDPSEEKWQVIEIVDDQQGTHFGPTVIGRRLA